jgi:hypothetical protein
VGWRAIFVRQAAAQDIDLGPGELCIAVATFKPAQRGAKRRKKDLRQAVGDAANNPRVVDPSKQLASGRNHGARF